MRSPLEKDIKDHSYVKRSIRGFYWLICGGIGQSILQIITLYFLAKVLSPNEFGIIGAAVTISALSMIVFDLGLCDSIIYMPYLSRQSIKFCLWICMLSGLSVFVILIISSRSIAIFYHIPELSDVLPFYALATLLSALAAVSRGLFEREMRFGEAAFIDFGSFLIGYAAVGISLGLNGAGYWALVGAHLSRTAISSISLIIRANPFSKKYKVADIGNIQSQRSRLVYYGSGQIAYRTSEVAATQADNFIVGRYLGAEVLGNYGRAYQLAVMPVTLIASLVNRVLFATVSGSQLKKCSLSLLYERTQVVQSLLSYPMTVFLFVLAPEIVAGLLGEKWSDVVPIMQIMVVGTAFRVSSASAEAIVKASGASYGRAWRQGLFAILVFLGAFLGRQFGSTYVAVLVLVAVIINYFLMSQYCLMMLNLRWRNTLSNQTQGLILGGLIGISIYLVTRNVRPLAASPLITLCVCAVISLTITILCFRFAPKIFLKAHGLWWLNHMLDTVPFPMNAWGRRIFS